MKLSNIILFSLVLPTQIVCAQLVGYQDITLPTPSIGSSISNYDVEGSNLAYGLVSPSINLFTIQAGEMSIPITLSHSYNGYKPNELPGVLGLGWTISGGGAVVKNIHGLDDDHIRGYPATIEHYMPQCSTASQLSEFVGSKLGETGYESDHFKRLIANGYWDGLPDKFVAFGPGLHEDFFQYKRNLFATFPYSSTAIDRISLGNEWIVINGQGIKYLYGEPNNYVEDDNLVNATTGTNTWQLIKIQSGNGESVIFDYGTSKQENRYQYRDAMRYGKEDGHTNLTQEFLNTHNYTSYSSALLESIKCSNYKLKYYYSSINIVSEIDSQILLPKIDSIRILDNEDRIHKVISFVFHELNNSFLLKEIKIKDAKNTIIENYKFTYEENMPDPISYPSRNMDHWGYANGNNFNYLFPKIIGGIELQYGGNREANSDKSRFGLLKSMQLPTGGRVLYDYEKNMSYLGKGIEEIELLPYSLSAKCITSCLRVAKNRSIRIPFNQEIKLQYTCKASDYSLACDGMGISIHDVLGNIYYSDLFITTDKGVSTTIDLEEGVYTLEIYSDDKDFEITAQITQKDCLRDENNICIEVDKFYDIGGHRIKRITQIPVDGSDIVSEILYHKSGKLFDDPRYETTSLDFRYVCLNPSCMWPVLEVTGHWVTRSGNSLKQLLRGGNPMMYDTVSIEKISKDEVIRSKYVYAFHSKSGQCANGSFYADISGKRGQVKSQYFYIDGVSEAIKKTENIFKDIVPEDEKAVIAIHQDFLQAGLNEHDTKYAFGSWCPVNDIRNFLDSSIITQDNVSIKKSFTYNNDGLLNTEKFINSRGEIVNTKYSYSNFFRSKPILIEQYINGKIVSGKNIEYNSFGQPYLISNYYDGIGYVKTNEIEYESFINVLDESIISKPVQQIEYGIEDTRKSVISQVWAYNSSFPVIIAQNTSYAELLQAVKNSDIGNYDSVEDFLIGVGNFFNNDGSFNIANKEAYTSFITHVQEELPEAFITFYTYSPLKGVTSQTEPNSKTTYYQYDAFGRVTDVIDFYGNILKSYDYNYANSQN